MTEDAGSQTFPDTFPQETAPSENCFVQGPSLPGYFSTSFLDVFYDS